MRDNAFVSVLLFCGRLSMARVGLRKNTPCYLQEVMVK